jgi:hypothetical protein
MVKDDSGAAIAALVAVVAGAVLAGVASFGVVSAFSSSPDPIKSPLVQYDAR